ncbi:MAG: 16S rRNA (uracil(1498)-N(3))-methyltransferase [Cyanobacteria bacterium P01_G01_bin.54]
MPQDLPRLYLQPEQYQGDRAHLAPEQCHYLYQVLRRREGDRCIVLDGQGQAWQARLQGNVAHLEQAIVLATELPIALTLVVALPKSNGFEEILRCGTELGVTTFWPVTSDRTLLQPNPKKLLRWRKIVVEAAEQSERAIVPTVQAIRTFSALLQDLPEGQRYLCVARGDRPLLLSRLIPPAPLGKERFEGITIATGPEGGWTSGEIEQAIAAGFESVSLGARVLRAVTAAIAAATVVVTAVEDKSIR